MPTPRGLRRKSWTSASIQGTPRSHIPQEKAGLGLVQMEAVEKVLPGKTWVQTLLCSQPQADIRASGVQGLSGHEGPPGGADSVWKVRSGPGVHGSEGLRNWF